MKNDKYLKIILTIIAICLVWICVRDIKIGGKYLFAGNNDISGLELVHITGIDPRAFNLCEPIQVEVVNWPNTSEILKFRK